MQGLEGGAIGGFNAMIEKQKQEPGEAFVSTIIFHDQLEVLHGRVKLEESRPITSHGYYVQGRTALLDAISGAIHHIGSIHKYARLNYEVVGQAVAAVRRSVPLGARWKDAIEGGLPQTAEEGAAVIG